MSIQEQYDEIAIDELARTLLLVRRSSGYDKGKVSWCEYMDQFISLLREGGFEISPITEDRLKYGDDEIREQYDFLIKKYNEYKAVDPDITMDEVAEILDNPPHIN